MVEFKDFVHVNSDRNGSYNPQKGIESLLSSMKGSFALLAMKEGEWYHNATDFYNKLKGFLDSYGVKDFPLLPFYFWGHLGRDCYQPPSLFDTGFVQRKRHRKGYTYSISEQGEKLGVPLALTLVEFLWQTKDYIRRGELDYNKLSTVIKKTKGKKLELSYKTMDFLLSRSRSGRNITKVSEITQRFKDYSTEEIASVLTSLSKMSVIDYPDARTDNFNRTELNVRTKGDRFVVKTNEVTSNFYQRILLPARDIATKLRNPGINVNLTNEKIENCLMGYKMNNYTNAADFGIQQIILYVYSKGLKNKEASESVNLYLSKHRKQIGQQLKIMEREGIIMKQGNSYVLSSNINPLEVIVDKFVKKLKSQDSELMTISQFAASEFPGLYYFFRDSPIFINCRNDDDGLLNFLAQHITEKDYEFMADLMDTKKRRIIETIGQKEEISSDVSLP